MPGYGDGDDNKEQNIKGFDTDIPKSDFFGRKDGTEWINPKIFSDAEVKLDSFTSYEASGGEGKIGYNDNVDTIQFSGGGGELHYMFDAETIEYMQTLFDDPADSKLTSHGNEDKTIDLAMHNEFKFAVGFGALLGVKGEFEVHFGQVEVHHRML